MIGGMRIQRPLGVSLDGKKSEQKKNHKKKIDSCKPVPEEIGRKTNRDQESLR